MKVMLVTALASVVLIFGFSQFSFGNDVDTSEEVEIEEEVISEEELEAKEKAEKNVEVVEEETEELVEEELVEVEATEAVVEIEETEESKDENLTDVEKAIKRLKEYLEIENDEEIHIEVDHEENGKYYIQVFDIEIVNGVGHTVTRGWYIVDKETGKVESVL
ncbi:hypothetical protein [Halalkalibacter akibai]|uniref:PepSY domain-containing protein n=1 Tax=Halalkalibacter akibai (strain ATCC 43226 / DSM 21942 / CIP 109018 / JCM 9157 / 1139) TaxID=1236973 RepID=W4QUD5_HALA3|nr:hypothetical protein [Halalkalibacter akibai]GAE35785.1 hypothetical protein JCM9157_2921 [Halalkalibacter akibai JCM 9157]